jgi:hypothetical protein
MLSIFLRCGGITPQISQPHVLTADVQSLRDRSNIQLRALPR